MPRFKTPDYGLKMIPVDFERQILPGSFEFTLCHLIDHEVDLLALRARVCNDAGGAPAFDPAVLLKIVPPGYSRGLTSSRSIGAACAHNVPFVAVSGDSCPHFTTIASFVSGLGKDIAKVFSQVLLDRSGRPLPPWALSTTRDAREIVATCPPDLDKRVSHAYARVTAVSRYQRYTPDRTARFRSRHS